MPQVPSHRPRWPISILQKCSQPCSTCCAQPPPRAVTQLVGLCLQRSNGISYFDPGIQVCNNCSKAPAARPSIALGTGTYCAPKSPVCIVVAAVWRLVPSRSCTKLFCTELSTADCYPDQQGTRGRWCCKHNLSCMLASPQGGFLRR